MCVGQKGGRREVFFVFPPRSGGALALARSLCHPRASNLLSSPHLENGEHVLLDVVVQRAHDVEAFGGDRVQDLGRGGGAVREATDGHETTTRLRGACAGNGNRGHAAAALPHPPLPRVHARRRRLAPTTLGRTNHPHTHLAVQHERRVVRAARRLGRRHDRGRAGGAARGLARAGRRERGLGGGAPGAEHRGGGKKKEGAWRGACVRRGGAGWVRVAPRSLAAVAASGGTEDPPVSLRVGGGRRGRRARRPRRAQGGRVAGRALSLCARGPMARPPDRRRVPASAGLDRGQHVAGREAGAGERARAERGARESQWPGAQRRPPTTTRRADRNGGGAPALPPNRAGAGTRRTLLSTRVDRGAGETCARGGSTQRKTKSCEALLRSVGFRVR